MITDLACIMKDKQDKCFSQDLVQLRWRVF